MINQQGTSAYRANRTEGRSTDKGRIRIKPNVKDNKLISAEYLICIYQ